MLTGTTCDERELRLRREPMRIRPLDYYQTPLPCSDREAGLAAAKAYDQACHDNRTAVLGSDVIDEPARKDAHRRMVAALDELRELGGLPLVEFVTFAGRHYRRMQWARSDGSSRDYHISWTMVAGLLAGLSHYTFGEIFWVA